MTSRAGRRGWLERLGLWIAGKRFRPGGAAVGDFPAVDVWGSQRSPTAGDLVRSYRGTAYACANLCAAGVASVPLRLYVQTGAGDGRARCGTRGVPPERLRGLSARPALAARVARAARIEEVTDHPALDLLARVNEELDGFSLMELTDLYMEVVGSAYWWLARNRFGIIDSIWVLEAQYVTAKVGEGGGVRAYEYGFGARRRSFPAEEILPFHMPNLRNPYHEGWSPLRAAYEAVALEEKVRANAQAFLENRARPDVIVSAKGEYGGLGEDEAERLERRFQRKFRRGKSGGVLVIGDEVDVKPLTFAPKEIQSVLLHQLTKEDIANAFGVPVSLL